jgi:adenosylhomocysteine nucleosidase
MIVITSAMAQETGEVLACLAGTSAATGSCPAWRGECAGGPVTAVCTGVGRDAVNAGLDRALAEAGITAVISAGFAGGLTVDLRAGDIVLGERILGDGEHDSFAADDMLLARAARAGEKAGPRVVHGTAVTVPAVAADLAAKLGLRERTGADICEMEDYWAARLAAARGLPFLSVRVVIDEMTTDLHDFTGMVSPTGVKPLRAARFFLTHPGELAGALRTWRMYRKARASLRHFMQAFLTEVEAA